MTRKDRWKKGFTLMELLGVVAIIGILCALTAVGVVAYNRSLKVMELNNTAEEIYIAAQNHLTALRTNATAEKALKDAGYGTRASYVSPNAPADLTASDKAAQWNAIYAFGSTTGGTASGSGVSGSTAGVSGSTRTAGSYAQIAAYVMPAGAVDGTVAGEGNSYIIEYNPSAYTVYGVFYTDGKSSVLGRDTGETISVTEDLGKLNKEVKTDGTTKITSYQPQNGSATKGICVGYYGGSGAANLDSHKLNGSLKLKIVNGDRLYAELTTRDLALADESPAEQADDTYDTYRIVLDVRGTTSGAEKSIGHTVKAGGRLDGEGSSWISLENPAIKGKTAVYKIVLDDITRQGKHFAEIFADGTTDNGVNFIPGENITVSANVFAVDKLSNIVYSDSSVTTNSLFGGLTSGSQSSGTTAAGASAAGTTTAGVNTAAASVTETVTISSFRHLENLSPRVSHVMGMTGSTDEDAANAVSLTTSGTGTIGAGTSGTGTNGSVSNSNTYSSGRFTFRAVLTSASGSGTSSAGGSDSASASSEKQTMSWSDFFKNTGHQAIDKKSNNNADDVITYVSADNSSNSSNNGSSKAGGSKSSSGTQNGSFSPVENPWLSEFNGGGMTIDGVYISADDSQAEARGLFGTIDQKCNLTIKNLKLQNFDITSSKKGFSDLLSGSGNSKSESGTRKSGSGNPYMICAGMLAGRMYSKEYSVTVQNVIALEKNDNYCGVWCAGNKTNVVRNGGLIGEIQTADDTDDASITVKKCSASVYVKSSSGTVDERTKEPGLRDVDIAGGLIGHIEGNRGIVSVSDSYAGGHTSNAQYSSSDKARGTEGVGRNVVSYGYAGGLIGAVYSNNCKISLSADYATTSVACAYDNVTANYSAAGGMIGYVSKKVDNIEAKNCYSTGLVEGDNKGGLIGYIALESSIPDKISSAFTNCRFLSGVNTDSGANTGSDAITGSDANTDNNDKDIAAVNILTQHATENKNQVVSSYDKIDASLFPVDVKTLSSGAGTIKAVPYDSKLTGNYPFASSMSCHYGDWPIVVENTIEKQNRLMLTYNTKSDLIAIRLTGLQSGAHMYLVMDADTKALPGPQVGVGAELQNCVTFDEKGKVKDLYHAGWNNNWKKIFSITKDKKTGVYHYELMLDNVSTQFAGFASLTSAVSEFYYGEYIDVRITDEISENTDLAKNDTAKEEYVTNTLFEDIFDPSVVKPDELQNGKVALDSVAVQNSIKNLKHIKTDKDGKEYIDNIDTPVTTGSGKYVAVINSARHLENLSSGVSKINTQSGFTVTNAVQGCDIVWDNTAAGNIAGSNHEYNAYVDELTRMNADVGGSNIYDCEGGNPTTGGLFYPVNIESDNKLNTYNGNGNSIYGLKLGDVGYNGHIAGLFGWIDGVKTSGFEISNLQMVNTQCQSKPITFGTLVGISNRNLVMHKVIIGQSGSNVTGPQFEGSNECGGMVGQANADLTVSKCAIDLAGKTFSVSGGSGGAAGIAALCKGSVTIQNTTISADSIQISGTFYTGGMIGNAGSSDVNISDSSLEASSVEISETETNRPCGGLISLCSSGSIKNCHISGLKSETKDAEITISATASNSGANQTGGLVGKVSGNASFTIQNSWLGADLATVSNLGSTAPAGGLIGEVSSGDLTVKESYYTGANARVMSGGYNQGSVGGLIGEIKINNYNGNCSIANDYFSGYVYGPNAQYVGGLIGRIESGGTQERYSSIENCYVSGRTYQGMFPQDSAYLTSGQVYNRFEMPVKQGTLENAPIDGVIGYQTVGGLIGCHDNGYLKISGSFTSTSVAGLYDKKDNTKGYAGGLTGSTCGTLQVEKSYAVSPVESRYQDQSVIAAFIAKDYDAAKTELSDCYVIKELNDDSVSPIGQQDTVQGITMLPVSSLNDSYLYRKIPTGTQGDTDTTVRDASLNTDYPNGYPYLISTTINGRKNFDGCWVNVKGGQPAIRLSETEVSVVVNGTHGLTATILPRWKTGEKVTWSSANNNVAKVGSDGTVTGVAAGSTTITAELDNGSSATCQVTVVENTITGSIVVNGKPADDNSTQYLMSGNNVTIGYKGESDEKVSWEIAPNVYFWNDSNGQICFTLPDGQTTVTAVITKNGVTVRKNIVLVGLQQAGTTGDFDRFNDYPVLNVSGTPLPDNDTRTVKGYTAYNNQALYLYISDSGRTPFGNTSADGSHYLYLKAGDTPIIVQIKSDNSATVQFLSKYNNQYVDVDAGNQYVSVTDSGTQLMFSIWLSNASDSSPANIRLQAYGSTSQDDPYAYTLTGLLAL